MMTRDRLAAFADGELSPEEAAEVVMHLADHPEDQAYVDEIMAANAVLARAFAAPMSEPVPQALRDMILGEAPAVSARILPFRMRLAALGGLALAASIAGLFFALDGGAPILTPVLTPGTLPTGSALHAALTSQPSGQTVELDGAELTILASLPIPKGHCRETEVIDRAAGTLTMALICDQGSGWEVQVALSEPLPEEATSTGFVAAGGIETGALDLWLDRLGAGQALPPAAEAEAIAKGWSAP